MSCPGQPDAGPRVLTVTRNFPPILGGMERLVRESVAGLAAGARVHLIAPAGCEAYLPAGVSLAGVGRLNPTPRFLVTTGWQALRSALRLRPHWVLAGSGLMAPAALLASRASGARAAVLVHGLDLVAPNAVYQAVFVAAIRRCDRIIANSANTATLAARAGVPEARIRVVHPGAHVPHAPPSREAARQAAGLGTGPVLLCVGRLSARKGLAEFITQALPALAAAHPDLQLLVAGGGAAQALAGGDASAEVRTAIAGAGMDHVVRLLGPVDDATLGHLYAAADVFMFPVREQPGDVEGFGMAALEAAAHGTPTAGFAVGGVPDAVADGQSGRLVPAGDYPALVQAVLALLAGDASIRRDRIHAFAQQFAWPRHAQKLRAALDLPPC